MQAQVGDELTVKGRHQGDEDRHGEIIEVIGADGAPPYTVRWRDGFESLFYIRLRPGSTTAQDRAPDTRGCAHLIHHPSGDGTGDAPSALAHLTGKPDPAPGADINDRRTELTGQGRRVAKHVGPGRSRYVGWPVVRFRFSLVRRAAGGCKLSV
jgi:hypothetical protein